MAEKHTCNAQKMLPILRQEIRLLPGPAGPAGEPTCILHDPLRGTYDKADWPQLEILRRLRRPVTLQSLLRSLADNTTLTITADYIQRFCRDLQAKGLTSRSAVQPVERLQAMAAAEKASPLSWFLRHYLYFRVPLLHPDAALARALPYARILAGRFMLLLYVFSAALGLMFLLRHPSQYLATFPRFFGWQGAVWYALVIAGIKAIHEFSHAFTAKAYGIRVPTMGLAFIVLWPLPYSDVTDSWRMADRRKRMRITLAGVLAELALAGMALCGWGITGPGLARSIFFLISSGSLVSTLLINLNPAMRYDGYYLASDLLGIDNLRARALGMARWFFRRQVLGMPLPCPEAGLDRLHRSLLLIYAIYAWVYRLLLYAGIAVLVYYKFTKIIGIFLFALEIACFFVLPAVREVAAMYGLRRHFTFNRRSTPALVLLLLLCLWLILPLQRTRAMPAIVIPGHSQTIYPAHPGRIIMLDMTPGMAVEQGRDLALIEAEELRHELVALQSDIAELKLQIRQLAINPATRSLLPEKHRMLRYLAARQHQLEEASKRNLMRAEFNGVVADRDESLLPGAFVATSTRLGMIIDPGTAALNCYLDQHDRSQLKPGDRVRFFCRALAAPVFGTVQMIKSVREETIPDKALTSAVGGPIAVRQSRAGDLRPIDSLYLVRVTLEKRPQTLRYGETGRAFLTTRPRSLAAEWIRRAWRVIVRESGF